MLSSLSLQQSLHNFWESITHPLLKAVNAKHIVEIGAADGVHTKDLLAYCKECDGSLDVIDPKPEFSVELWKQEYASLHVYEDLSLNILPRLRNMDAVIIDGDHNWYTVFHELVLIEKSATSDEDIPLIILHDTGWPYARRDVYYNPKTIPDAYRKVYVQKGLHPDSGSPVDTGGLNAGCNNAIEEHSYQNGVRTAIEDFLEQSNKTYDCIFLPGFFGLGVLISQQKRRVLPALDTFLEKLTASTPITKHLDTLETARIDRHIALSDVSEHAHYLEKTVHALQGTERHLQEQIADLQQQFTRTQSSSKEYIESLEHAIEQKDANLIEHQKALQSTQSTLSWKLTAPLRFFGKLLGNIKRMLIIGHCLPAGQAGPLAITDCKQAADHSTKTPLEPKRIAACTIVSKNYIAQARVLATSFLKHHPGASFYVLLVDVLNDEIDPHAEVFTLVQLEEIDVPNLKRLCFQYTCRELNTAVKPAFLQHLLHDLHQDIVLYIDPDIEVFQPMDAIFDALESASLAVTPHLLKPIDDEKIHPSETDILQVGTANLGFLGLKNTETTARFLAWWNDRLQDQCFENIAEGMFFDQKWVDLAQSLFGDVVTVRDPSYNVAFWNLQERSIGQDGDVFTVNDKPLVFFHFSGYRPENPDVICHYPLSTHRFTDHPRLRELFAHYQQRLLEEGYERTKKFPYAFAVFENGIPIPQCIRRFYRSLDEKRGGFGDPFALHSGCFFDWLNAPAVELRRDAHLSNLHRWIYTSRPDLQARFPELKSQSARTIGHWLLEPKQQQTYDLHPVFVESLSGLAADQIHRKPFLKRLIAKRDSLRIYRLMVLVAKRILSQKRFDAIQRTIQKSDLPVMNNDNADQNDATPSDDADAFGVTIAGYITSENGVGEATRSTIQSLKSADVPLQLFDVEQTPARRQDETYTDLCVSDHDLKPDPINIIHVNADQVSELRAQKPALWKSPCTIGYWYWELARFPEQWKHSLEHFNEIWVGSTFCQQALKAIADIPVTCIPPSITKTPWQQYDREHFGIDSDRFVFLFVCDFLSIPERKNPLAIVEAFKRAFPDSSNVQLYLKCVHMDRDPVYANNLRAACRDIPCILKEDYMEKAEISDLLHCCDAYVSLHRSEGFGLTMAHAMAIGKPVIATNYSGNTDFMTNENSFPVQYALKEIERRYGPYGPGAVWAEPNIDHAAAQMRYVYLERDEVLVKGKRAMQDMKELYDPQSIGKHAAEHLEEIYSRIQRS